jgi:hypothetical protein
MENVRYRTAEVAKLAEVTLRQLQVWDEKRAALQEGRMSSPLRRRIERFDFSLGTALLAISPGYNCGFLKQPRRPPVHPAAF